MDSPIAEICAKMDMKQELSHEEYRRLLMFVRRNSQLYELLFIQYQECRIPDQIMQAYERRIVASIQPPFSPEMWANIRPFYTDDFVEFVGQLAC